MLRDMNTTNYNNSNNSNLCQAGCGSPGKTEYSGMCADCYRITTMNKNDESNLQDQIYPVSISSTPKTVNAMQDELGFYRAVGECRVFHASPIVYQAMQVRYSQEWPRQQSIDTV